ncbi:type IV secretion system s family protein (plasmid) [Yersinia pseudotuberculosis IP 32953]|uniref:TriD protein n=1 Tax=Yersinia pseudotuberculosis serotype I (strain IP32953) TaxID=273123 RepID=Q663E7_YERPS|nr:type IV secretion system protein [Yersinia pseudotuberculosis]AJJ53063.1 type IV secretion system s family protein [Yersinia pseudotuberculosis IP 32953]CAF25449.1 TriD protein [Yersinia pseudotuberculosis IP 32953]
MSLKTCVGLLLCLLGAAAPTFAAGIIVFDPTAKLENAEQWAKELRQWENTAKHYTSQIDAYKAQLATATGLRDIGSFVNQAKGLTADLKNLQKNGTSLNSLLSSGGSMSGELEQLYSKYSMFDICNDNESAPFINTCKQTVVNKAIALEESEAVQQKITETLNDVSQLSLRLENATDSKESQDLANTLSLKTVQLNTLTTQWEMNAKQSEMRDKLLIDKQQKAFSKQQSEAPIPTFH